MSEKELKLLSEQDLGDMILCEPVTNRGIEALQQLGLKDVILEENFFDNMYITSKYVEGALFTKPVDDDNPILEHVYSVSAERFNEIKKKLLDFDKKFTSDSRSQSPLLIIGTAGNGKSIEARFKIRNPKRSDEIIKCNRIFYNLEESLTELTNEITFSLNEKQEKNALWLICMALLDGLYKLVKKNYKNIPSIINNHQECFIANNSADDTNRSFFLFIKDYDPNDSNTVRNLFKAMIDLIDNENANQSIERLLKMTMNVMYCICPKNKNYIVFDNLEHYIKLNAQNIPITTKVLSDIYNSVVKVTENIINIYDRIHPDESWRSFKIILVLRRTSRHLLTQSNAQNATKYIGMENDYTGHFDIWNIWEKKKKFIWEKHLKDKYAPDQSSEVLFILDDMMNDKPGVLGTSYQELISPLMNSGIRRNGRAQAHAAMSVYDILHNYNDSYINFEIIKKLLLDSYRPTRYLYRRALLEIHYKWMIISNESHQRFTKLFLGKLLITKESQNRDRFGNMIKIREVIWTETEKRHVTLVRRILSYLSNFKDEVVVQVENDDGFKTGLFATKSLYDLMTGIFLAPTKEAAKELNDDDHFIPLSTVLVSLGSMSHSETKAAPLVIIDINDERLDSFDSERMFADILKEIWEAKAEERSDNGRYRCKNYCVRLTEAGDIFLRDIQPSFSFFAALYCSEEVPLFFLTDPERIKLVITMVHDAAQSLHKDYELAANRFCDPNISLLKDNYLPKHKNIPINFRHRVKTMHSNHLYLYKDFIDKNADALGLTNAKNDLIHHIDKTIRYYNKWEDDGKGSTKCF